MNMKEMKNDDLYLVHHGVMGQKWGVRRYQNPDGTLTPLGKKQYEKIDSLRKKANKYKSKIPSKYYTVFGEHKAKKNTRKAMALEGKAYRLERRMEKIQLKNLSKRNIDLGKEKANKILNNN